MSKYVYGRLMGLLTKANEEFVADISSSVEELYRFKNEKLNKEVREDLAKEAIDTNNWTHFNRWTQMI